MGEKSKIQYRKITELIAGRLKPKEAYLFYCMALKSDFITNESYITQDSLAKYYGIKDVDQIRVIGYMSSNQKGC